MEAREGKTEAATEVVAMVAVAMAVGEMEVGARRRAWWRWQQRWT